jgi:transposase
MAEAAPELLAIEGVSLDTADALLIAASYNAKRLKKEAIFAHLCAAALPIPAFLGKTVRHRFNRHGDRHADRALYMIAICT